jgi:RNA polymerase sigma-70 factor, ECF subfamily
VTADPREALLPLQPKLRAYARRLVNGDEHAADDLVQDALLLALRSWDTFAAGTNLKAWLFRILHNRHLSLRQRHARRLEVGVEADVLARLASVPAFQEGRAELPAFKAAFARLAPSHREALVLWAVHGLSYERIAEVCGSEVSSVKSRIHRARTALRAMVLGERAVPCAPVRPKPRARRIPAAPPRVPPAPVAAVPVLSPVPPEPILVRRALVLPAGYGSWLADVERSIVQAELHVTCHRRVVERLGAAGVTTAGVETAARLAEERLGRLEARRQQLLDAGAAARPGR